MCRRPDCRPNRARRRSITLAPTEAAPAQHEPGRVRDSTAAQKEKHVPQPHRIDVHHHPSPPSYLTAREGGDPPAPVRMSWTVEKSLETMDQGACAASILSLPHSPDIWGD